MQTEGDASPPLFERMWEPDAHRTDFLSIKHLAYSAWLLIPEDKWPKELTMPDDFRESGDAPDNARELIRFLGSDVDWESLGRHAQRCLHKLGWSKENWLTGYAVETDGLSWHQISYDQRVSFAQLAMLAPRLRGLTLRSSEDEEEDEEKWMVKHERWLKKCWDTLNNKKKQKE
eukprot:4802823-Prymnesium_polylepis.1